MLPGDAQLVAPNLEGSNDGLFLGIIECAKTLDRIFEDAFAFNSTEESAKKQAMRVKPASLSVVVFEKNVLIIPRVIFSDPP